MLKWLLYYGPATISLFSNIKLAKYIYKNLKEEGYLFNKDNKNYKTLIIETLGLLVTPFIPVANIMNSIIYFASRNDKSVYDDFYQTEKKLFEKKGIIVEGTDEYKEKVKEYTKEKKIADWCDSMGLLYPQPEKIPKSERQAKPIEEVVEEPVVTNEVVENKVDPVKTYKDAYALWNGTHEEIHDCPTLPTMDEIRKMDEELVLKKSIGHK